MKAKGYSEYIELKFGIEWSKTPTWGYHYTIKINDPVYRAPRENFVDIYFKNSGVRIGWMLRPKKKLKNNRNNQEGKTK